ncbi:MAG: hypothetical protein NVS3B20_02220 [Polyangiales bacterium]
MRASSGRANHHKRGRAREHVAKARVGKGHGTAVRVTAHMPPAIDTLRNAAAFSESVIDEGYLQQRKPVL